MVLQGIKDVLLRVRGKKETTKVSTSYSRHKPVLVPGVKVSSWSVCHEITFTKSATKDGIWHFIIAALPRIANSLGMSMS